MELRKIKDELIETWIGVLDNGLTVYMSPNSEEPRIQTFIAVKAGFKQEPDDATGLAHYLEHMMFKGSDKLGTSDWKSEEPLLKQIEELYEQHRQTPDPEGKKKLYKKIDELSAKAAAYALPNEYDRLVSTIGAKNTNAYTSYDQTVYINDIPANELEKWMMIEAERFRKLVLRLFHTELETVYEEFNMRNQDSDSVKVFDSLFEELFPGHNYGRQPSIGKPEHLKNPSMKVVYEFFNKYYVPNNMAICMSGDLNPEKTFELVNKHFGSLKANKIDLTPEKSAKDVQNLKERDVWGNEAEYVTIGVRSGRANSKEAIYLKIVAGILYNKIAGLIDIDLNQKQKVLQAYVFPVFLKDYSVLFLHAVPKSGQDLKQTRDLLINELMKLKNGEYEDWLVEAVINDHKYKQLKDFESNFGRADAFTGAFVNDIKWEDYLQEIKEMEQISKEEISVFAQSLFDNFVTIYKKQGNDPGQVKIEKPEITPIIINRDKKSEFSKKIENLKEEPLKPEFIDFDKEIKRDEINGVSFSYVHNKLNKTFSFYLIYDEGTDHNRLLSLALKYFNYLGTSGKAAEEIKEQFFRLGVKYGHSIYRDQTIFYLHGLEKSCSDAITLLFELMNDVQEDAEVFTNVIADFLKEREDQKSNKSIVLRNAMTNYAKYGGHSPFSYTLTTEETKRLKPGDLVKVIKAFNSYKPRVFLYSRNARDVVMKQLDGLFIATKNYFDYKQKEVFIENEFKSNKVYFKDFNTVQTEIIVLTKDGIFDEKVLPEIQVFNNYFGSGLSSIVYQEIRESKALAYSAYSLFTIPRYQNEGFYSLSYIGTQSDKLVIAMNTLLSLLSDLPLINAQYEEARESAIRKIESERITKTNIFWTYEENKRRGIEGDIRERIYNELQSQNIDALKSFFEKHVKKDDKVFLVLGKKERINLGFLRSLGEVKEVSFEEIFGF